VRPSELHHTYAFPSGHTTAATFIVGTLLFVALPLVAPALTDEVGAGAAGQPASTRRGRVSARVWRAAGAAQRHALPLWAGAAALTATGRVLGDVHWCGPRTWLYGRTLSPRSALKALERAAQGERHAGRRVPWNNARVAQRHGRPAAAEGRPGSRRQAVTSSALFFGQCGELLWCSDHEQARNGAACAAGLFVGFTACVFNVHVQCLLRLPARSTASAAVR